MPAGIVLLVALGILALGSISQNRVSATESKIADYPTFNDAVNIYNIQTERFPGLLMTLGMNMQRHSFLEVPEQKKEDVKVASS